MSDLEQEVEHSAQGTDAGVEGAIENFYSNLRVENPSEKSLVNSLFWKTKGVIDYMGSYFSPKRFERWKDGLVYKLLGVHYFKKIVPNGGSYANKLTGNHPISSKKTKEEKVHALCLRTACCDFNELLHLGIIAGYLPFLGYDYVNHGTENIYSHIALNLFVNVFPILLQRYNRALAYNGLDKLAKKEVPA